MSSYVRLTLPIDNETAGAARRVRALFDNPAGADLCAGIQGMSVDTLERIHTAVAGLYFHTQELMELARGERVPLVPPAPTRWKFTFQVLDEHRAPIGAIEVPDMAEADPARARLLAVTAMANDDRWDHEHVTLSQSVQMSPEP